MAVFVLCMVQPILFCMYSKLARSWSFVASTIVSRIWWIRSIVGLVAEKADFSKRVFVFLMACSIALSLGVLSSIQVSM